MADIVFALWTYPTLDKSKLQKTIDERFAAMEKQVEKVASTVTNLGTDIQAANAFHAIFAAPEYFFTAPGKTRAALTVKQKDLLYLRLAALSKKYPKILMIPGSVFFKEEVNTLTDLNKMKSHLIMSEITAKKTLAKRDYEDVLTGWTTGGGSHIPALKDIAEELDEGVTGERVRNVAYIFLGGDRQAMYDKHVDFTEAMGVSPDNLFFIPGTQDQCPVIGNFKFGLEICFDHASAVLSRRKPSKLDFHVVLSAYTDNEEGNMAMANGGFFLHSSSSVKATGAYIRKSDGGVAKLISAPKSPKEGDLLLYRVDIDKRPLVTVVETPKLATPKPEQVVVKGVKLPIGAIKLPMPPTTKTTGQ